jgi:hypothetical protein
MMETVILDMAFFIAALANIIFSAIAIITKNAEGQLYSVFMSFALIMLSVMYDRPVLALVGGLTIALMLGYHAFKCPPAGSEGINE